MGISSCGSVGRHRSWADVTVRNALPDLFGLFLQNYSTGKAELDKALGWYVHSNETEAMDVSIILNQAVLELLTYLTIGPGWEIRGSGWPIT